MVSVASVVFQRIEKTLLPYDTNWDPASVHEATNRVLSAKHTRVEAVETPFSRDTQALLNVAQDSPGLVNNAFVLNHFKHLSIVDCRATALADGILDLRSFCNVTELCITGNILDEIDGRALPPRLEILHAGANRISGNLATLSQTHPDSLNHVGLACNELTDLRPNDLPAMHWNNLLSLDVSHNHLEDIVEFASTVGQLPSLALLSAAGNPFCLLPFYRSYVVTVAQQLQFLDDVLIDPHKDRRGNGVPDDFDATLATSVTLHIGTVQGLAKQPQHAPDDASSDPSQPHATYTYRVALNWPGITTTNAHISPVVRHLQLLPNTLPTHHGHYYDGNRKICVPLIPPFEKWVYAMENLQMLVPWHFERIGNLFTEWLLTDCYL
eukprot:m.152402 g.152402  ORF g.152402 m.152402 type:complete len:382 (-) comp17893_c0_seq5:1395-2540(-)